MNALSEIKNRFKPVLDSLVDDSSDLLDMIRPAKDGNFGDYQVNCAMPLKDRLGKAPRDIAADLIEQADVADFCEKVEVAGPGFINLTLQDRWLAEKVNAAFQEERLGVAKVENPRKFVVDFSSPNVAKPMHVGHIRSTVIGDALSRILRFVGHDVISDNHLGDWGTQFGMIIYGYKHFLDQDSFDENPVGELGRLYKLVRKIMDYHSAKLNLPNAEELLTKQQAALDRAMAYEVTGDKKADKQNKKDRQNLNEKINEQRKLVDSLNATISSIEESTELSETANQHTSIGQAVLQETADLHAGDETNTKLWNQFLPFCREDIQRIYQRLGVSFDYELGESFYHDQLPKVVDSFKARGLAKESEGALCVFMDEFETPMIIQKKDGAFLYSTSDLATIQYRMEQWNAEAILYVVDHRQHEHFDKLFAAASLWGYDKVELNHVSFGTVLGDDGKPYKTRSGDTVGLEGLLDEAVNRAREVAQENNSELTDSELDHIADVVGIGGLKYIDLAQNRLSDYKFSYDKMLAKKGNTATYLQYSYARVQGIFRKCEVEVDQLRTQDAKVQLNELVERKLALVLTRFSEALDSVLEEYKPNLLAAYLFDLTQVFFQFYDQCKVKDCEDDLTRQSRLQLCDLTGRTIKTGLDLLGIRVVDQM
ncbi:MAG: arginine--tRNA ligase [Planctomycetota bacterium]